MRSIGRGRRRSSSCYYDPEVGRFINSDDVSFIGATGSEISYNPFAYCENNPVHGSDPSGNATVNISINKRYYNNNFIGKENGVKIEKYSVSRILWISLCERAIKNNKQNTLVSKIIKMFL